MFRNLILKSLGEATLAELVPHLTKVDIRAGQVLQEQGRPKRHAFFIERGLIAVVRLTPDGSSTEASMVGSEGLIGSATGVLALSAAVSAVVQIGGEACRIPSEELKALSRRHDDLADALGRYAQYQIDDGRLAVACNARHSVQARLAKWLLMSSDRAAEARLEVTQELVSELMGVQRTTVTETLGKLAEQGAIRTRRGAIEIVDRRLLTAAACGCYGDISARMTELMLGHEPAGRPKRRAG